MHIRDSDTTTRATTPDAVLAGLRFGGSFRADDPDGFLVLLAATAQVAVETRGNETVLRSRR